ncbi:MAG: response regulator, partial [Proteobacteria bacterium]|nr:response regulator [Burkholderiales bacterium]
WRTGDFALVLTDLHMPEMDGYALTAAIRAEERSTHRTPIIALTANALRDEELRCRAVGMDAYLTKPIRLPQLKAALESWLVPAQGPTVPDDDATAALDGAPVDLNVLVALVGDDPVVIGEVLQAFRKSATQSSGAIRQGIEAGSAQTVADASHKLKSGARSIGAHRLGTICAEIEHTAETGRAGSLGTLLQRFDSELAAVDRFLDSRPR